MSDEAKKFLEKLDADDLRRLSWLLAIVGRIEGWCAVNRWIGKVILVGGIGALILLSNVVDAVKNLIGLKH